MKFVFLSHNYSPGVSSPANWVEKIKLYAGFHELLRKGHEIIRMQQINTIRRLRSDAH